MKNFKLLRVMVNNFKLCDDDFTISFVPVANKPEEDKEHELEKIDDNLYAFTTIGIIGKNASGKTTTVELLNAIYDILSYFRIRNDKKLFKNTKIKLYFYFDKNLYRYETYLNYNEMSDIVEFNNEKIYVKKYFKSYANKIFNDEEYELKDIEKRLPIDMSNLYLILNDITPRGNFFTSNDFDYRLYPTVFKLLETIQGKDNTELINKIIKMFDSHIDSIKMKNDERFIVKFTDKKESINVNSAELENILSSGTSKGIVLFTFVTLSLKFGTDLVVDEIENHFHKTLVRNLIRLYKDKKVNKNNATLIFTTHYPELLDMFNRSDNIYITKFTNENNITIENMHEKYSVRPELVKSKKFYQNYFGTNVDYDALMSFKKELMK